MDKEVETKVQACEYKATIGTDGQLVIETPSEECQKIAIEAASKHGVDVKHVKPKAVTSSG